jgi:hypothetical protein
MTQTRVCKHVGHGGLAGEELTKSSTHRSSNKKVGEDRDLHNLSIYAPGFRRRGHVAEKIDVFETIIFSNII